MGALLVGQNAGQLAQSPPGAAAFDPQQVARGQQIYAANCASCHGVNLEGQPNWRTELPTGGRVAPPHDANGHTWHHDDALLFNIVKQGKDAIPNLGNYKYNMPAFGDRLSDAEIRAVLTYIASTWPPDIQSARATRIAPQTP